MMIETFPYGKISSLYVKQFPSGDSVQAMILVSTDHSAGDLSPHVLLEFSPLDRKTLPTPVTQRSEEVQNFISGVPEVLARQGLLLEESINGNDCLRIYNPARRISEERAATVALEALEQLGFQPAKARRAEAPSVVQRTGR